MSLNVIEQPQKLKMILNIINKIAQTNFILNQLCWLDVKSYKYFFTQYKEKS